MEILVQIALLAAGFLMLIKGADWFVDGASAVAKRLGIPELIIGLTIVAMGTSAPEAAISISASLKGSADIAVGNVLGSNIMNILVILGVTAVITPLAVQKTTVRYEIPFVIAITVAMAALGLPDGSLGFWDGILLWALFLCYLGYLYVLARKGLALPEEPEEENTEDWPVWRILAAVAGGMVLIVLGSNLAVDAATRLARIFGMSERFIGLTIVALGTSLPELVTSVTAGLKHKADIAVGNIVGSNIFNILFVLGTSALITPVAYQAEFLADSLICVAVAVLLLLCALNRRRALQRWGGALMLVSYVAYFAYLIR